MFAFLFEKALQATVMSTALLIRARTSKALLMEAYGAIREFEEKLSAYKPGSLLEEINKAAGKHPVACDRETLALVGQALKIARETGGRFDPTIGALSQGAYGFGTEREKLPQIREFEAGRALVDYRAVQISDGSVFLEKEGMRLDLGGIGKGYAAEAAALFLQARGARHALVSVGGEICCFGRTFTVGVKDPFGAGNLAVLTTTKEPLSVATSGDYERFIGSRRHHHILNAASGLPTQGYAGMTLIKKGLCATELDALATALFSTPETELAAFAKTHDLALMAVASDGRVILTNLEAAPVLLSFTPRPR
jgi:thiamine biosynthesis lipoprotein